MKKYYFLGVLVFISYFLSAQISGTVFRDFNGNGTKESAEPLVAGVVVKAYDVSGAQCGTTQTSTSAVAPNYTINGCSGQVRIEFEIPASACQLSNSIDYSGLSGSAYGSSVQFVGANSSNVNFAVHYPSEYGGSSTFEPAIYSILLNSGDPIPTTPPPPNDPSYTANKPTVTISNYLFDDPRPSNNTEFYSFDFSGGLDTLAKASQTGTLWGNAYSKQANRIFVSAMIRRHCGMGPLGPGGIYMINPASPDLNANLAFANLDALGFSTHAASGAYNIKSNTTRALPAQPNFTPTTDADAYDQVGKTSLGDMDISENGRYLFVINLFDRKIYRLDLQDPANPQIPTAAQISSYNITNPCSSSTDGEFRPFALKVYRGKLYVGLVCSGQDASNNEVATSSTDISLTVYEYDLGINNIPSAPVLFYSQDFSYRETDDLQNYAIPAPMTGNGGAKWRSWMNEFTTYENEPMLTDIEFDNSGDLLLGISDRNGYQTGGGNNDLNGNAPNTKVYANGDIIKVIKANCNFSTTASGSYLNNDFYQDQARWGQVICGGAVYCHSETVLGALAAYRQGDKDEVVTTALNPARDVSNGYLIFNNLNGDQLRGNELFRDDCNPNASACLWKSAAMGDIELLGLESPIEIGNRVWNDTDNDGIQDPGEAAITGVTVQLVKTGSVIATAQTDANGNYYFSSGTGINTASVIYGIIQLMPNMAYTLRIPSYNTQTALLNMNPTTANTGGAGQPDVRDSDGAVSGSNVEASILTTDIPINGANNHTFDFGFAMVNICSTSGIYTTQCNDNGTPANSTDDWFTLTVTGTVTDGSGTYVVKIGAYTSPGTPSGMPISITGNGQGGNPLLQANGSSTYTIRIEDSSDSTCFSSISVGPVLACSNCTDPNCFNVTKQIIR
ncbi:MAG: hypothetical protein IPQ10_01390 [Saprospiraceae bacterium]|nr:hypothetical protein [Saprospiraceae bacterium]MBK7796890.1 hypothetical protein [Saprospiraceae bacterium]MBK8152337.1 hypothetical protein [Saprospiraceae bacterium]MBL0259722.1 hypothetical protein [Saprospiraceae bacterium]